jgi:hypothetical protein
LTREAAVTAIGWPEFRIFRARKLIAHLKEAALLYAPNPHLLAPRHARGSDAAASVCEVSLGPFIRGDSLDRRFAMELMD